MRLPATHPVLNPCRKRLSAWSLLPLVLGSLALALWASGPTQAPSEDLRAGRAAMARNGCYGCHTVGQGKVVGPDLQAAGVKYDREKLVRLIHDPEEVYREEKRRPLNPGFGTMPRLQTRQAEAEQIADYLIAVAQPVTADAQPGAGPTAAGPKSSHCSKRGRQAPRQDAGQRLAAQATTPRGVR